MTDPVSHCPWWHSSGWTQRRQKMPPWLYSATVPAHRRVKKTQWVWGRRNENENWYQIKSFNRIAPDSIVSHCQALVMDAMKQHCGWHVKLGNVLREIWAAASGTAARAQDKGSCLKCMTSLIGDILERTSGNSGVGVTTSMGWPVGWRHRFILGYSTKTIAATWGAKTVPDLRFRSKSKKKTKKKTVPQHNTDIQVL